MSKVPDTTDAPTSQGACPECLRHSWLLAQLSPRLGYHARDHSRLLALLALDDEELIQAIGGQSPARAARAICALQTGVGALEPRRARRSAAIARATRAGLPRHTIGRRGCCTWRAARPGACKR